MKRISKKTAARKRKAEPARKSLLAEVGKCEMCGHDPQKALNTGFIGWHLAVHEIVRGTTRQAALDKRFATLVLCFNCHMVRIHGEGGWPEARQLAVLKRSRPKDYDLDEYNALVGFGPNRITEEDVKQFQGD